MQSVLKTTKHKIITLLKWSEKYTKTDMVYFAHNGFWVILGQLTVAGSAFITTLVLANMLTKEIFGQYRFIITIVPILGLFTLPALGAAIARSVARGHAIDWSYIIRTKIIFGIISIAISAIIAGYYALQDNESLSHIYIVISLFIALYNLFLLYDNYLQGIQKFKYASIYVGITRIIQAALIIITALTTNNILLIIGAFFLGLLLPQYLFYKRTRAKHTQASLTKNPEQGLLKYSIRLNIVYGIMLITGNLDKLFAWYYLGDVQFAIYAIALALPINLLLLFNFIPQIYFPNINKLTLTPQIRSALIKKIFIMIAVLCLVAGMYAFAAPFILPTLFSGYPEAIPLTMILAFLIPILPANTFLTNIFQSHNKLQSIIFLRILIALIYFSVFLFFFNQSPHTSVAIAFIISEASMTLLSILILRFGTFK